MNLTRPGSLPLERRASDRRGSPTPSLAIDTPHYHRTANGRLVACYHKCKMTLTDLSFWLGVTLSFPLEHFIWERIPGFSHISKWLGL